MVIWGTVYCCFNPIKHRLGGCYTSTTWLFQSPITLGPITPQQPRFQIHQVLLLVAVHRARATDTRPSDEGTWDAIRCGAESHQTWENHRKNPIVERFLVVLNPSGDGI